LRSTRSPAAGASKASKAVLSTACCRSSACSPACRWSIRIARAPGPLRRRNAGTARRRRGDGAAAFDGYVGYAERHREIIRRFGRFPHRNAILGRTSTPEEIAFLQTPGSSFLIGGHSAMKRLIEIRSYKLKAGEAAAFHEAVVMTVMPMLREAMDVVAYGPSAHEPDTYFLIRAYADLADLEASKRGSTARPPGARGPRNAIVSAHRELPQHGALAVAGGGR
jgi:hypothetical protein